MSSPVPAIAVRGSTGVHLSYGPPTYETVSQFSKDVSKICRTMLFSPEGSYFAWANGVSVKIVSCKNWSLTAEIPRPKVCCLEFSPRGTYLSSWEPFSSSNSQENPNLHIFKSENGELVKEFVQKKQTEWELNWSLDEKLCARKLNNDVVFYENANFDCKVNRISCSKIASFSLAPSLPPYFIVCNMPGKPGQPSFGRMFQYPKFEISQAVGSKTFFQVDKVNCFWNAKCNSVLLMTSTEVDKTGASYYGKQTLHYMNTRGDTALVILSKEGPIYSVEWSPKSTEFCVVYGFMPAKATLFNLKCEPVFELGTGPQNSIYFNRHGNILLLGGFGNLRGQITLWDLTKLKMIGRCEAADTTQLAWAPDGVHFATATTAPRLRIGNGYKIWHYTGTLLYERPWNMQEELYEICWQKYPQDAFQENAISYKPVEGIRPSAPQASKQAYRPPSARGRETNFKLHDDEDTPSHKKIVGVSTSKTANKPKKQREAQKNRKQAESNSPTNTSSVSINNSNKQESKTVISLTGDPEKDKKIKNIKKKLDAIIKLKEEQASGKTMQINQISKIKTETDLIKELKELTL